MRREKSETPVFFHVKFSTLTTATTSNAIPNARYLLTVTVALLGEFQWRRRRRHRHLLVLLCNLRALVVIVLCELID